MKQLDIDSSIESISCRSKKKHSDFDFFFLFFILINTRIIIMNVLLLLLLFELFKMMDIWTKTQGCMWKVSQFSYKFVVVFQRCPIHTSPNEKKKMKCENEINDIQLIYSLALKQHYLPSPIAVKTIYNVTHSILLLLLYYLFFC